MLGIQLQTDKNTCSDGADILVRKEKQTQVDVTSGGDMKRAKAGQENRRLSGDGVG